MLHVKYFEEQSFYKDFKIESLELDGNITIFDPLKYTKVKDTLRNARGNFLSFLFNTYKIQ